MNMKKSGNLIIGLKLITGPLLFILLINMPIEGMTYNMKILASTLLWVISWWVLQPIPWAITSLLPLVILPLTGVTNLGVVTAAYGQKLLFFLLGVLMLGYAFEKHGLGRRIALYFMSLPFVGNSVYRIILTFMAATAIVSAFVDDAATVAMMTPIGISIARYVMDPKNEGKEVGNLGVFMALGVLYAAEAGGMATLMGYPHNPLALSLLENINGISINFVDFMKIGIIISIVALLAYFMVLRIMIKPEITHIQGATDYFRNELMKLGPFTNGERNTLITLFVMVFLWVLPIFIPIKGLDTWIPPIIGLLLLFILPCRDNNKFEATLTINDFQQKVPWNIIFLSISGAAMSQLLVDFKLLEWIQLMLQDIATPAFLVLTAGVGNAVLTNFVSGLTAVNVMGSILLPLCHVAGVNPVLIARILPNVALGYIFPWAGAAAAIAFAAGNVKMKTMIKIGFVATVIHVIIVIGINLLLVPIFYPV